MLIHDKGGNCQLTYKGKVLEVVDQFKYLGFIVHKSGKLKFGVEDIAKAGLKAMTKMFRTFRKNLFLFSKTLCHLFNVIVMPVLMCVSELWGYGESA